MDGIKILFLTHTLNKGGTPKHVAELLPALAARGFEVHLRNLGTADQYYHELRDAGIDVKNARRLLPDLILWIRRLKPDIVHSYLYGSHIADAVTSRLMGVTYVMSTRNQGGWRRGGIREKFKILLRSKIVKHHLVNSHDAASYLNRKEGVHKAKITVIENGIADRIGDPLRVNRASIGLSDDDLVMVACQRLGPGKRVDLIIRAFASASRRVEKLKLMVIGYGPSKPGLIKLAGELGVGDRVLFVGYQPNPFPYLRIANIFISASAREGLSNSILEAMMFGLPCIVTDTANSGDPVLDGVTGRVVPDAGGWEALAEAMVELAASRERLKKMGKASRKRYLERFTLDMQVDRICRFYQQITGKAP